MENRRRFGRIHLSNPLPAFAGSRRVFIIDASLRGFRIAHEELFDMSQPQSVSFQWDGENVETVCRVVRTRPHRVARTVEERTIYHSGLEITSPVPRGLRSLVEHHVARALDEQKANARGIPPSAATSVQSAAGNRYVRHELVGGRWRETMTTDAAQAACGFTVSAAETKADIALLREAFERGDASSRAILRTMAAMSIGNPDGIPSRKYMP